MLAVLEGVGEFGFELQDMEDRVDVDCAWKAESE